MADPSRATAAAPAAAARTFQSQIRIRFGQCDPAGIVFFPRYMEMFNNLVEDWCREELDLGFAELHRGRGWGVPTVHLEVDFIAPSFLGELLSATLAVRALGTSSIRLAIELKGPAGDPRVRAESVLVLTDAARRPCAIPADLRARMDAFRVAD